MRPDKTFNVSPTGGVNPAYRPPSIDAAEIARRFDYHPPSGLVKGYHQALRDTAKDFARAVLSQLPDGREKALAFTAFEEATFWAHAAIAREPSLHASGVTK